MSPSAPPRRRFLARAAAAPLLAVWPGATFARDLPAPALLRLDAHRRQARIAEVNVFPVRRLCVVEVVADDGTRGYGEAGHSGIRFVADVVRRELAPVVVGRDVFDAEPTHSAMYFATNELGPGGIASQAIAGVDCALWDLRGKLLGLPVHALIGGKYRDVVPLYGSFSLGHGEGGHMSPEEAAERAARLVAEGFRTIKLRLNIRERNIDPADDPAIPYTRAVRRAIGDDVDLWVDPNNGYTPSRAIQVGRRLQHEFNVTLFEEPVAAYAYASFARVADALDIPVAGGEHEYTLLQFHDLIVHGRVDIVNPDVSKLSGITEGKKVAALAEAFDRPIIVHNARPTLLTAAHLHYVASCRLANRPQEHPGSERLSELWQYFHNRLVPENGCLAVPDVPGLGLEVDRDALARAAA